MSDLVHLDVCMWRPTPGRPFHTFATLGMSDLPMTVPPDAVRSGAARYAELVVSLPADWPVPDGGPWADETAFMPVRALKTLGRLPHEPGTWLGLGHTVPNGDPAEPLPGSPNLTGFAVLRADTLPEGFRYVGRGVERVDVLSLWLLTTAEMELKLERGIEELLPILRRRGVSELLDIGRTSTVDRPRRCRTGTAAVGVSRSSSLPRGHGVSARAAGTRSREGPPAGPARRTAKGKDLR